MSLTGQGDLKRQDSRCPQYSRQTGKCWKKVKQGAGDIGQGLQCPVTGHPVKALLGEGLLRTAESLCSGLVLRVRGDSTHVMTVV